MAVSVLIRNQEPEGAASALAVVLVTVGDLEAEEVKHVLPPQGEIALQVRDGQFLMVDETHKEAL